MTRRFATLELEPAPDWLTVWLDRPDSRNALNLQMTRELREVLAEAAPDRKLRGVTLRGRGGTFCAGGDLKDFATLAAAGSGQFEAAVAHNLEGGQLFESLRAMPQVVVVLVEGAAMAGGLGMACCADFVGVTRDAQFALTETTLGIPPAQIAPHVAARLGVPAARRLMLTAARFTGVEAQHLGLADAVVDDSDGLARFEAELQARVRRCAPGANAAAKEILLAMQTLQGEAWRQFAAGRFASCMTGPEGREGMQAFVEKRKPSWAVAAGEAGA